MGEVFEMPARRAATAAPTGPTAGRRAGLAPSAVAVLAVWALVHGLVFAPVPVVWWLPSLAMLAATLGVIVVYLPRDQSHPTFGWANAVTLLRAGLAWALLTPLLAGQPAGWAVAGVALVALALDGVDGWLARRHGRASGFGARFDMEVDSILALLLSLHAWAVGGGWWIVLFLGLARYLFVGAAAVLPWLNAPLPSRFTRKAVCVVQLAALIALQAPVLPPTLALWLAWGASAAVVWSFAVDILWLARRR